MELQNDKIAWMLSCYLLEMDYVQSGDCEMVYDWLNLCTNLKSVSFDIAKYDESVLYCGSVWDYVEKQSEIWEEYNFKLIQFNYAWCALESLIDVFLSKKDIKDDGGKIKALNIYLTKRLKNTDIPDMYAEFYKNLVLGMLHVEQFKKSLENLSISLEDLYPNKDKHISFGSGVLVVYKVRNRFAHGTLKFPTPDDEEYECQDQLTIEMIELSTAIVLMTIAMVLMTDCNDDGPIFEESVYCMDIVGKNEKTFLKQLYTQSN